MAGLLSFPSQAVGLMGRTRNQQLPPELLAWMQGQQVPQGPIMADAADEAMYARNPNGSAGLQALPAGVQAAPNTAIASPAAPAARNRVSGWRVLDRVLGGQTVSEGLDTERTRLQTEADRPTQQARIAAALGSIADPREQALFLGLGAEDWQKNVGQQFAPQVVAEGALQSVYGSGGVIRNPRTREFGDSLVRDTPQGVETLATRGPTIAEQNAQNRLDWDRQYGQTNLGISQQNADSTRMNAQTTAANSGFTLAPGAQRFDANGNPVAAVAPAQTGNPQAAANRQAAAMTTIGNARSAVADARRQVGVLSTGVLANLIPGNQWRANLEAVADTIEANLSFAELQKMREASPTGGALGGIAIRELELLGATVASLRTSQSPQQYERNLQKVDQHLNNWEAAIRQAQQERGQSQQEGSQQPVSVTTAAEAAALPPGTLFRTPDGRVIRRGN